MAVIEENRFARPSAQMHFFVTPNFSATPLTQRNREMSPTKPLRVVAIATLLTLAGCGDSPSPTGVRPVPPPHFDGGFLGPGTYEGESSADGGGFLGPGTRTDSTATGGA